MQDGIEGHVGPAEEEHAERGVLRGASLGAPNRNSLCLPAVMRFNLEAAASHYARLASLFSASAGEMPQAEAAARSLTDVESLIGRIGIACGLRNHGVPRESLGPLSAKAFEDSCHKTNIRACTQSDLLRLYEESW